MEEFNEETDGTAVLSPGDTSKSSEKLLKNIHAQAPLHTN